MAETALETAVAAALLTEASNAQGFSLDGMSVTNRDPRALIELDKHAAKKTGHRFGFGLRQMIPPEHG